MTQLGSRPLRSAPNNVYTVLVIIAFLALAMGIAAVWLRTKQLNPDDVPWSPTPAAAASPSLPLHVA